MQKIVDFLIGLGSEKMRKRIPKPLQNGAQDGPKSIPEGSSRGKWEKCKNEQHYKVLARFLLPQGVENRRKNRSNRIENDSKLECTFEGDFLKVLVDFGSHLGSQDGAKIEEKRHQKQERF